MAKKVQKSAGVEIVADTAEEQAQTASGSAGSDYTYIACGLALGHKFDDVDNGNGGFKTVELPGINYKLSGETRRLTGKTSGASTAGSASSPPFPRLFSRCRAARLSSSRVMTRSKRWTTARLR